MFHTLLTPSSPWVSLLPRDSGSFSVVVTPRPTYPPLPSPPRRTPRVNPLSTLPHTSSRSSSLSDLTTHTRRTVDRTGTSRIPPSRPRLQTPPYSRSTQLPDTSVTVGSRSREGRGGNRRGVVELPLHHGPTPPSTRTFSRSPVGYRRLVGTGPEQGEVSGLAREVV